MPDETAFGVWLRQQRQTRDLTQAALGAQLGCSGDMVRKMESGRAQPSRGLAERLATWLALPPPAREPFIRRARALPAAGGVMARVRPSLGPALRRGALPAVPSAFIGREVEQERLQGLLARPEVRLVTLTGPGGAGKTRLSVCVADNVSAEFADGVCFVPLAAVQDPALVIPAIAAALGLPDSSDRSLQWALEDFLRDKALLLVLDNCEQVVSAAPAVAALLARAPRLKLLATSREVLHIYGEYDFPIRGLALPAIPPAAAAPVASWAPAESVRLFLARAEAVAPALPPTDENLRAVAAICHRLDGLPLAIELAAARSNLFAPPALLARLEHPLDLLTAGPRDVAARQQTLRGTIAWSYDLLAPAEQGLFRRLGVFSGGCTLAAAEALGEVPDAPAGGVLEGVAALLGKSMLQTEPAAGGEPGEARIRMLETVREYAGEALAAAGEAEQVQQQHAAYYLALAEAAEAALNGPDQARWLTRLAGDLDNLRAALHWALGNGAEEIGARLASAVWRFWWLRGHLAEGRAWLERILAAGPALPAPVRAAVLSTTGFLAAQQGHYAAAATLLRQSVALCRVLGSPHGLARALNGLGLARWGAGDLAAAEALYTESLTVSRAAGDCGNAAGPLSNLAICAQNRGDNEAARALLEEAVALFRECGNTHGLAVSLSNLGVLLNALQEDGRAAAAFAECLTLWRALGSHWGLAQCLVRLAAAAGPRGPAAAVARLFGAADAYLASSGAGMWTQDRAGSERSRALLRAQLGESGYAAAWAAGHALRLDAAAGAIAWTPGPALSLADVVDDALQQARAPVPAAGVALGGAPATDRRRVPTGADALSRREEEVLRLVARGLTNAQVAGQLFLSPHTVQAHLRSIYGKLGGTSRPGAIRYALEHALG